MNLLDLSKILWLLQTDFLDCSLPTVAICPSYNCQALLLGKSLQPGPGSSCLFSIWILFSSGNQDYVYVNGSRSISKFMSLDIRFTHLWEQAAYWLLFCFHAGFHGKKNSVCGPLKDRCILYPLNVGIAQGARFQGHTFLGPLCDIVKNIVYRFATLQTIIF